MSVSRSINVDEVNVCLRDQNVFVLTHMLLLHNSLKLPLNGWVICLNLLKNIMRCEHNTAPLHMH